MDVDNLVSQSELSKRKQREPVAGKRTQPGQNCFGFIADWLRGSAVWYFSQSQSATSRYQNTVKPFTVYLFSRVRLVTSIAGAYFPFVNGLCHFLRSMPPLVTNDDGDVNEKGIKSIECFHMTWHHIGVPKQWNGSHVGVLNQSCGSWTLFLCKRFLLFQ